MTMRAGTLMAFAVMAAVGASPAISGTPPTPTPEMGVGLAAMIGVAVGYRALRRRIKR